MSEPPAENAGAQPQPPYPNQRYAWWVASALALIYVVGYIDRQALTLMMDMVKTDLGVSDTRMGWLVGSFAIFYAVAALPFAQLADSKSRRVIIAAGIFGWTIMTAACGLARSYWQLFIVRIGVGVGEATLLPSTYSILGDYLPRDKLPRALSVFQMGAITGTGLAFFIVGTVIKFVERSEPMSLPGFGPLFAWQETFLYIALPGFLALALMLTIKEPLRRAAANARNGHQAASGAELWAFYKANRKTILTHHLGFTSLAIMVYGFIGWITPFFGRIHGVDPGTFGQVFGALQVVFGNVGVIGAAFLAEYLTARGMRDANIVSGIIGGAVLIPVAMLTVALPSLNWAWVFLVPSAMLVSYPFGIAHGALPVIVPPNMRARVGAIYNFFFTILGMALGLGITGMLTDYLFTRPEDVGYSLMVMIGFFGPIGIGLLWLGRKPYAASVDASKAWHGEDD